MLQASSAGAILQSGRYYLRRLLGDQGTSLHKLAYQSARISEGRRFRARRPFFESNQLTRIRDAPKYSAQEIIRDHFLRETIDFRPVYVHCVRDGWIIDGSVFIAGAQRIELRNALENRVLLRRFSLFAPKPFIQLEVAALVGTCAGSTWFGHWLEDEVPLHLLASSYASPIAHVRQDYAHERGYLQAFGLPIANRAGVAHCETLMLVEEFAQNPHKTLRYQVLRQRLAQHPKGKDRVFLIRGDSGTPRRLINEIHLAERLAQEGFHIVDIGRVSFASLLEQCLGASIVVGVEGSHLAHALYMMKDYGKLLILNPPGQVHTTVADVGVFCRLHAGMFICEGSENTAEFSAQADDVLRFLDKFLSHSDHDEYELRDYVDEVIAMADQ